PGRDRCSAAGPDLAQAVPHYGRVLGMPGPPLQRGAVIKADMAVFNLGPTGLTIARPAEPGPAAEALARRGPGPFQVLYRTHSMDAAARWMADHGVPPPARGVRNTGEPAVLVSPRHARGAFHGFRGPGQADHADASIGPRAGHRRARPGRSRSSRGGAARSRPEPEPAARGAGHGAAEGEPEATGRGRARRVRLQRTAGDGRHQSG